MVGDKNDADDGSTRRYVYLLDGHECSVGVRTRAVVSEEWGGAGDGCLGLPFLKQFGTVDMDLRNLQTTLTGTGAGARAVRP